MCLDEATVVRPMTLTGVVRTSKGLAVATVVLDVEGNPTSVKVGRSQSVEHGRPFVAREHKRLAMEATQRA